MTKKQCALLLVTLSLMLCVLSVGYASVTDNFSIRGNAKVEVPSGLFITEIEKISQSGLDVNTVSFAPYSTTVDCQLSKSSNSTAGSATYRITVFNNTQQEYAFRKLYYQTSVSGYNNDKISTTNSRYSLGVVVNYPKNGNVNATIGPGEMLSFEVTYTLGANSSSFPSRNTYKTLINYQFGINVNSEEEAVEAVHHKFLNILNTSSTYGTLVDVLDNKYDGVNEWTSNYVGNVGNATSDDALAVNTLFAGQLEMIINGETKPATVIIKHENVDNNTLTGDDYVATANNGGRCEGKGCEMTLYLTTHSLSRSDSTDGDAPVYVTVFTCDRDANGNRTSEWYKVGDIYEGRSNIVGYKGEANGDGSFVTDNWTSYNRTYTATDQYAYTVYAGTTIKTLMQTTDDAMTREFQRLLAEAKEIIEDTRYAGTGIDVVERAYEQAAAFYTLDANGSPVATANIPRAKLCPIVRQLYTNIEIAREKMEQIQSPS